jgi:predicted NAD-dependent protein-ADP-ribosyltransferase YbiA (DUF1768 family)
MDVGSKSGFPAGNLSNFTAHAFVFDGIECASMEGLLQSFKYDDVQIQREICKLTGFTAQRRGQERNEAWKSVQRLWWKGQEYDRHGSAYQELLTRAFDALSQNESFRKALLATGDEHLTHRVGKADPRDTVLTEQEFCSQLIRIRSVLRSQN